MGLVGVWPTGIVLLGKRPQGYLRHRKTKKLFTILFPVCCFPSYFFFNVIFVLPLAMFNWMKSLIIQFNNSVILRNMTIMRSIGI